MNWDDYTPDERVAICGVPYPKVTVCRRPEYEIQYEQIGEHTLVHVTVHQWTPASQASFAGDCDALQDLLNGPVMALCLLSDTKLRKFCAKFGFEPVLDVVTADGAPAVILRRNKKHGSQPVWRRHREDQ